MPANAPADQHEETPLLNSQDPEPSESPPTAKLLLILSGPYFLAFTFALDSTLVATLATPIANDFANLHLLSWLASAFFVANSISQPLAGHLSTLYGRRSGLLSSALLFCAGNTICAASGSAATAIAGRVIAGLGGGAIGPIATFVVGDLLPLRRRGLWQGTLNFWFGIGSSLGGPVGGFINDAVGWRAAFWMQIPITLIGIGLLLGFMPRAEAVDANGPLMKLRHIDFPGAITMTATLVLVLFSLSAGGSELSWTSPLVIVGLGMSALLLPLLYLLERRHEHAIVPPRLLMDRSIITAALVAFLISLARSGLFFYGPVFFLAQGYSTTQTGLRFISESLAVTCSSLGAGFIMHRTGRYYILNVILAVIFTCALSLVATQFSTALPRWTPFVIFFFVGMGYSGMISTTLLAFNAAVSQDDQAIVTSASYVFRSMGSALSVSLSSTVFHALLVPNLVARFGDDERGRHLTDTAKRSIQAMRHLPDSERKLAVEAYLQSLKGVWYLLLGCAGLALVASVFQKEHRLHRRMDRTDVTDRKPRNSRSEP